MNQEQKIINITPGQLTEKVRELSDQQFRLVQINCTKLDAGFELNYSFDKELELVNLRLSLSDFDAVIPSVSGIYLAAFLYENETADLFGAKFQGIAVDFKGNFYNTHIKHPFNPDGPAAPEVK